MFGSAVLSIFALSLGHTSPSAPSWRPVTPVCRCVCGSGTSISVCAAKQQRGRGRGGVVFRPRGYWLSPRGRPARRHLSTLFAWGGVRCLPVKRGGEVGRERAAREGGASGRREQAARAGGASGRSGRRERAEVERPTRNTNRRRLACARRRAAFPVWAGSSWGGPFLD